MRKMIKKTLTKTGKIIKKTFNFLIVIAILAAIVGAILSSIVIITTEGSVYSLDEFRQEQKETKADAIIVLGCAVWSGSPSPMLRDRLDTAIELYFDGVAPKILMSGDHGQDDYNEVGAMREYAINMGVPSEDIFMDHAGFSTYETMYRASKIFGIESAVVVTQKYHLNRSLYNAKAYGITCVGVDAGNNGYIIKPQYYPREIMAQAKDLVKCLFKVESTYLGEEIDIHGNGEVTLD